MHYFCTGDCKGVADEPKVCEADDCSMKGQPLKACDCGTPDTHAADKVI